MALDFPSSPSLNQEYTSGGKTWRWNGVAWDVVANDGLMGDPKYLGGVPFREGNLDYYFAALENINTTPIDIVMVGDSTSEVGNLTTERPWPWLLSDYLNRYVQLDPPVGYVFASASQGPTADDNTGTPNSSGFAIKSSNIGSSTHVAHTAYCDRVSVIYQMSGSAGTITIRDGGPSGTILDSFSLNAATRTYGNIWTSDALTAGTHTIYISASGGANFIEGFYFYRGNYTKGVRVWPCAKGGATSQTPVSATADEYVGIMKNLDHLALFIYATGINDYADYDSWMRTFIDTYDPELGSASRALWIPYILPSADRFVKAKVDLARQIAEDYDMGVIDASVGIPDMSVSAAGLKVDSTHPNAAGSRRIARHALEILSGDPQGSLLAFADLGIKTTGSGLIIPENVSVTGNVSTSGNLTVTGDLVVDDITADDVVVDTLDAADITTSTVTADGPFGMLVSSGNGSISLSLPVFGLASFGMKDVAADAVNEITMLTSTLANALYAINSPILAFSYGTTVDSFLYRDAANVIRSSGVMRAANAVGANDLLTKGQFDATRPTSDVMPTSAITQTVPRWTAAGNLATLASGTLVLAAINLIAGQTVSTVTWVSGTTALSAGTHQWFGLWAENRTCLRVTNNDTSTAWGTNAGKTLTLTTPYVVPTTGVYYMGIMVAATTPPTLRGPANASTTYVQIPPILIGTSNTGMTTPPAQGDVATALTSISSGVPYAYVS